MILINFRSNIFLSRPFQTSFGYYWLFKKKCWFNEFMVIAFIYTDRSRSLEYLFNSKLNYNNILKQIIEKKLAS